MFQVGRGECGGLDDGLKLQAIVASPTPDPVEEAFELARLQGICEMAALIAAKTGLETLVEIEKIQSPFARSAMFTGLVVNYARAFEPATNESKSRKRSFSIRGIAGFDRKIHAALLKLRNEYMAHAGHLQNDYDMMFIQIELRNNDPACDVPTDTFASVGLGSRAQASLLVGLGKTDPLQKHLTALYLVAANRLGASIVRHSEAFMNLVKAGKLNDPKRRSRKIASGKGSFNELLQIPMSALLVSAPEMLAALPLDFVSLFYQLEMTGPDAAVLKEIIAPHITSPP